MDKENIKISACILTRNDSQFIKGCIDNIFPYIDEIVILDASDDDKTENIIKILKNFLPKPVIYKRSQISQDLSKDRNEIQSLASGDYVLHIDCDERFDTKFLSEMKLIIGYYLNDNILPVLFRLPRANLPDNINYPDYQIRLLYKKYTTWRKMTHETPYIVSLPENPRIEIGMHIKNLVTIDRPIAHLYKDKTQIQKRWDNLVNKDPARRRKKLLVLSMFKNSSRWIREILTHMNNAYKFNEKLDDNDNNKLDMYFSFVDGQSDDDTFSILENYCKEGFILDIQLRQFEPNNHLNNIDPNDKFSRFKKLAKIRNHLVEQSVRELYFNDEDYILFADSDIKFEENAIHELIKDMGSCKADIIAPMIYIENFRDYGNSYFYDVLAFRSLDGTKFGHNNPYFAHLDMDRPNQVSSVGSFYVMKYKVAKAVSYSGEADSEQVEFCNNVRAKNFEIFVTPRLSVQHINFDKYNLPWH